MLFGMLLCFQVLFIFWDSGWVSVPPVIITAEVVCLWPYSVDILVKLVTFLGSLHWPSAGGVSAPGVGILLLGLEFSLNCMLTILSVSLGTLTCS